MLYCEDWEKKKKKYLEFWARENHDRPLLYITVPKEKQRTFPVSGKLRFFLHDFYRNV